ncbi:predicted protein [Sclerotinia sclerotiorum 1980 UF-70]|uniref:Uncharacterized protein n=2 Tax=Sclerotinia sclerotiorum (strain ATCC 18683 / 1980 / Ss-1) TaxID=665079 RepID=A7ENP2_SCLS1|nr:predicted protein [Sclerotinia sclerotiorum 1980 UF-70]APA10532.1 hypothetical protein sscle_06g053020 [Sclerotinia sclerotiorum 1980 UF-70]EDO04458.1 predicted protein [Sclerotinia sclerotiorum 1980 UF-70]
MEKLQMPFDRKREVSYMTCQILIVNLEQRRQIRPLGSSGMKKHPNLFFMTNPETDFADTDSDYPDPARY